jgi:hypothetical protein
MESECRRFVGRKVLYNCQGIELEEVMTVWIPQHLYAAAHLTLLFRKFREVCRLLHNEIIVKNVAYNPLHVGACCNSSVKLLQSGGT